MFNYQRVEYMLHALKAPILFPKDLPSRHLPRLQLFHLGSHGFELRLGAFHLTAAASATAAEWIRMSILWDMISYRYVI